ncbi:septation protein SepH [Myceligenerans cantabricum]
MDELELVRLHEDGDRLVVTGPDGAEHTLPITDALRAAVRGDRSRPEYRSVDEELAMRPKDIQARLRAGATADELATESGMPLEQIRRFEYPVASEREHAVGKVRSKAVMADDGGTATIGDLADKRLRERASDPAGGDWTATRDGVAPWVVTLRFDVEAGERVARWSFDPRGGGVTALDDEARWLALPEDDGTPVSRTVTALPPTRGFGRAPAVDDQTDLLLDGLSERRGQRPQRSTEPVDLDAGELDLDELSPRRRRPDGPPPPAPVEPPVPATPPAAEARPAGPSGDTPAETDPASAPAAVVDLGTRRGKGGAPPEPGQQPHEELGWDGPSRWEIPGPDDDGERRPRTAALKTGGPLTGAIPKALAPASAKPARGEGGAEQSTGRGTGEPAGAGTRQGASTGTPDPRDAREARPSADQAGADKAKQSARRRSARRGRAQVPSWDEIVFGSRPES